MADMEGIRYAEVSNVYPSFTRDGRRCLRMGSRMHPRRGDPRIEDAHTVRLIPPDTGLWRSAHVFVVSLSPETHRRWSKQPQTYRVVALERKSVENYLQKRYVAIARKWMGAARFALVKAQEMVSTRSVSDSVRAKLGKNARRTAEGNLRIRSFGGDTEWTVEIQDNLSYAAEAFKRSDAVEFAMAKAANSIAGMLRKRVGDLLDPSLATPFPEISRHRRPS